MSRIGAVVPRLVEVAPALLAATFVYRVTGSLLAAGTAGLVPVVAPRVDAETGTRARQAVASLAQTFALIAVLSSLEVIGGPAPWLAGRAGLVPTGIAVALVGLLYATRTATALAFVVGAAGVTVVTGELRWAEVALLGLPVAALVAAARSVATARGIKLPSASAGGSPELCRPAGGSPVARGLCLLRANPFVVPLLVAPVPSDLWAGSLYWWALAVAAWACATTFLPPLRRFGPGDSTMQASLFPTAFGLAASMEQHEHAVSPVGLVVALALVGVLAFLALMDRRRASADTRLGVVVRRHQRAALSVVLFAAALRVFSGDLHYVGTGDTAPAELLPIAIVRDHSLALDGVIDQIDQAEPLPWWVLRVKDRVVSAYPIVPGLLNLPLYVAAGWRGQDLVQERFSLSESTAATLAALSVPLMFLVLANLCRALSTAVLGALVYAFATCVWSVASKAMWQHGPSLLFTLAALAVLTRRGARIPLLVGLLVGMAVWTRPTNLIVAAAIAAFVAWRAPRDLVQYGAGLALPLGGLLLYSWVYLGRLDTFGQGQALDTFRGDVTVGFLGVLASPNRGLFVFSPVLLLGLAGLAIMVKHPRQYVLALALAVAALALVAANARWLYWWGGHSFGYRLLIEAVPALVILLAVTWEEWIRLRAWRITLAAGLAAVSVYVQWLGATYYPCGFNVDPDNVDDHPQRLWDVQQGEIARCTAIALRRVHG